MTEKESNEITQQWCARLQPYQRALAVHEHGLQCNQQQLHESGDFCMHPHQQGMLEYPRYDKRPACPLSTVFRTCHAIYNVLTVFALDPLPRMYVSFFITTLRPTRPRTNVYINSPNLLLDLARLRGSLFNLSE